LALTLVAPLPAFPAPEALVDAFLQKSGLAAQIAQIEAGVLQGLDQSQQEMQAPQLSSDQLDRLRRSVKTAYGADRLRAAVRTDLVASLTDGDVRDVLTWLDTPFGKRVTALEVEGSTTEAYDRLSKIGAATLASLAPARRADLERMLKASGSVDPLAGIIVHERMGVMRGIARSAGLPDAPPGAEAEARVEQLRSQMAGALEPVLLANAAALYAPLSDDQLRAYSDELESPRRCASLRLSERRSTARCRRPRSNSGGASATRRSCRRSRRSVSLRPPPCDSR
jgi:hypothetical protein